MPRIAALAVDIQNCFTHPMGKLYVQGGYSIVRPANKLLGHVVYERDGVAIASFDWHHPESRHFEKHGGRWPTHGVMGTWDALPHKGLRLPPETFLVYKGMDCNDEGYDLWNGKFLNDPRSPAAFLNDAGVDTVLVFGIATEYCDMAAALGSVKGGFKTYLVRDACCAVNLQYDDEQKAIKEMVLAGVIMTTVEEVINGNII